MKTGRIWIALLCAVCILGGVLLLTGPARPAEQTEALAEAETEQPAAPAEAENEPLRVTVMDVGKGDCILLSKGGSHVMIDTGYEETADRVIAAMRRIGADHLDALIITHYDKDHVGGAKAIIGNIPVGQIYLPGYEGEGKQYSSMAYTVQQSGVPAAKVTEDISFTLSGVSYEIFATPLSFIPGEDGKEGNDNDVSLAVAVHHGEDSLLFPGDIEIDGIAAFLAAGHGTYDVVKMPHHGQNEKNSDEFIEQVKMKIAVITDSEEEPVKKKMLKMLGAIGADVYCSSANGRITITCTGDGTYDVATEK